MRMLLNEFLKEHTKVGKQQAKLEQQQETIAELKSTVAQQQKGMEVLTARLKGQASQIQKVSAQLEASRPAPQVGATIRKSAPHQQTQQHFNNQPSHFTRVAAFCFTRRPLATLCVRPRRAWSTMMRRIN